MRQKLIVEAEQSLYDVASKGSNNRTFEPLVKAATEAIDVANRAFESDIQGISGIPTGFIDIDKKLGGLQNSDYVMERGVLLPLHHGMTENMFIRFHSVVNDFFNTV